MGGVMLRGLPGLTSGRCPARRLSWRATSAVRTVVLSVRAVPLRGGGSCAAEGRGGGCVCPVLRAPAGGAWGPCPKAAGGDSHAETRMRVLHPPPCTQEGSASGVALRVPSRLRCPRRSGLTRGLGSLRGSWGEGSAQHTPGPSIHQDAPRWSSTLCCATCAPLLSQRAPRTTRPGYAPCAPRGPEEVAGHPSHSPPNTRYDTKLLEGHTKRQPVAVFGTTL